MNTPLERFLGNLINNASLTDFVWLMVVLSLIVYLVFAFIIVRQVSLLTRTLGTALSPWLKLISWLHFGFSLLLLIVAIGLF
jgi:hypothetical protein